MRIEFLKSKIHRCRVTEADIDYEGSIDIDKELMKKANILPYEKVLVANFKNGNRYKTYAVPCETKGSIKVNGAGALYSKLGDILMIACFATEELEIYKQMNHKPTVIQCNEKNQIKNEV